MKKSKLRNFIVFFAVVGMALVAARESLAATSVELRIEGSQETLVRQSVSVGDCSVTDTNGIVHTYSQQAICAVVAATDGTIATVFEDFGFGLFLKALGNDATPADFSTGWNFLVNFDPASTGVDGHTVSEDESLLLAFSGWPGVPLRVTADVTSATAGQTVIFTVDKRVGEYDDAFVWLGGHWEVAEGATLFVNDEEYIVPANGRVSISVAAGDTALFARATGSGLIRSAPITVALTGQTPQPTPAPTPTATPIPTPTLSPVPSPSPTTTPTTTGISEETRRLRAQRALHYLRSQQSADGTIDGPITSAWSALAFGAWSQRPETVAQYDRSLLDGLTQATLNSATDIERQILAVRAGGSNPRTWYGSDLVARLLGQYRNRQIGEEGLLNDDIFGILALVAAGESVESPIVRGSVEYVMGKQEAHGGWDTVDMTAAAVQALRAYRNAGGDDAVDAALGRARAYLKQHQDIYGGWGTNSASTAWGLQAIVALGENPGDWLVSGGYTPWSALLRYQNINGGFGWTSDQDVSPFMTAYAATALRGLPWPVMSLEFTSVTPTPSPAISPSPTGAVSPKNAAVLGSISGGALATSPSVFSGRSAKVGALENSTLPDQSPPVTEPSDIPQPGAFLTSTSSTPLERQDWRFILTGFGLANAGIGVAGARLVSKLFFI